METSVELKIFWKAAFPNTICDIHGKLVTNFKKKGLEMELEDGGTSTARSYSASAQTSAAATSLSRYFAPAATKFINIW